MSLGSVVLVLWFDEMSLFLPDLKGGNKAWFLVDFREEGGADVLLYTFFPLIFASFLVVQGAWRFYA